MSANGHILEYWIVLGLMQCIDLIPLRFSIVRLSLVLEILFKFASLSVKSKTKECCYQQDMGAHITKYILRCTYETLNGPLYPMLNQTALRETKPLRARSVYHHLTPVLDAGQ